MARILKIPKNPSCSQIEDLNVVSRRMPTGEPIVLSLARHTDTKFFAENSIAQLIAQLSRHPGQLVIRDTYHDWSEARFLSKIDGVSALVYSQLINSARLENTRRHSPPSSLLRSLKSRLSQSGQLDEKGPIRTLIAADPDFPAPVEIGWPQANKNSFGTLVRAMLGQYETGLLPKTEHRRQAENQLINFAYETFQNTIEHGRYTETNDLIPGIRYFRIKVYLDNQVRDLVRRAIGFRELEQFLQKPRPKWGQKRFVELTVSDVGQGITSHFLNSRIETTSLHDDRASILQKLVGGRLSSKRDISGVGLGLPNALSALKELNAFLSLRTEEFWLYRDYTHHVYESNTEQHLIPVEKSKTIAPLPGTQFNILIDFPM